MSKRPFTTSSASCVDSASRPPARCHPLAATVAQQAAKAVPGERIQSATGDPRATAASSYERPSFVVSWIFCSLSFPYFFLPLAFGVLFFGLFLPPSNAALERSCWRISSLRPSALHPLLLYIPLPRGQHSPVTRIATQSHHCVASLRTNASDESIQPGRDAFPPRIHNITPLLRPNDIYMGK